MQGDKVCDVVHPALEDDPDPLLPAVVLAHLLCAVLGQPLPPPARPLDDGLGRLLRQHLAPATLLLQEAEAETRGERGAGPRQGQAPEILVPAVAAVAAVLVMVPVSVCLCHQRGPAEREQLGGGEAAEGAQHGQAPHHNTALSCQLSPQTASEVAGPGPELSLKYRPQCISDRLRATRAQSGFQSHMGP